MALTSEFGDILDSLRGRIVEDLSSLEGIFRGGRGARLAGRTIREIAPEERGLRELTFEDFLRRIEKERRIPENEIRTFREGEFQDIERALRERVKGLSAWKKAAIAGLGLGGAAVGGLALLSYLNNRNQGSYPPPSSPSSPYGNVIPPPPPPSAPGGALGGPSSPSSPSAPGALGVPLNPSSPSTPSSPSSPSGSLEADLNKKIFGVPAWVWIIIALVIIVLILYYYYHKKKHKHAG